MNNKRIAGTWYYRLKLAFSKKPFRRIFFLISEIAGTLFFFKKKEEERF